MPNVLGNIRAVRVDPVGALFRMNFGPIRCKSPRGRALVSVVDGVIPAVVPNSPKAIREQSAIEGEKETAAIIGLGAAVAKVSHRRRGSGIGNRKTSRNSCSCMRGEASILGP